MASAEPAPPVLVRSPRLRDEQAGRRQTSTRSSPPSKTVGRRGGGSRRRARSSSPRSPASPASR